MEFVKKGDCPKEILLTKPTFTAQLSEYRGGMKHTILVESGWGDGMKTKNAELMHDLRLPLQLMVSCAQLLEMEVGENERARGYVQMLLGNAMEMQRMLSGAMERLRPETGPARYVRSDLVARTWESFTRCQLYAERKGVQMNFYANTDRLELALDEEKFSRILLNLVSNALKFTPEGGQVRISVRALGDFAEVEVEDNGCGIASDRLNAIFELHETDSGYGYGLYIAKEYARQMGGSMRVTSRPGEGSTFTLRIPVRSVSAAQQENSAG